MQQIQQLEMQKHALELQNMSEQELQNNGQNNNIINNNFGNQNFSSMGDFEQTFNNHRIYGSESGDYHSNNSTSGNEDGYDGLLLDQKHKKPEIKHEIDLSNLPNVNFSKPPPGFEKKEEVPFQNGLPDLSKPPPGFPQFTEVSPEELMPSVPYFELPAGLMVPLIMV